MKCVLITDAGKIDFIELDYRPMIDDRVPFNFRGRNCHIISIVTNIVHKPELVYPNVEFAGADFLVTVRF